MKTASLLFPVFGLFCAVSGMPGALLAETPTQTLADDAWFVEEMPCADSTAVGADREDGEEGVFPADVASEGISAADGCDPGEGLLFRRETGAEADPLLRTARDRHRAAFTLERAPDGSPRTVLRGRSERDGWSHRLELRDGTPARWQLGRSFARRDGNDEEGEDEGVARLIVGDLRDTALRAGARGLPRRTLPRGWKPAPESPTRPLALMSTRAPDRLQGVAAGVRGDGWSAFALHARNPVTPGGEPPWREAWTLRHDAAGVSATRGIPVSLHASHTRVARGAADSLSETVLAAALAPPGADFVVARGLFEGDGRDKRGGWLIAADVRRELTRSSGGRRGILEFTARQRDAGWVSAWDPAVGAEADEEDGGPGGDGGRQGPWGAGEIRLAATLPEALDALPGTTLRGDLRRAWNPGAGTRRWSARGTATARTDGLRTEIAAVHRTARAASGSVSLHRGLEADLRFTAAPGWHATAWRTWNREGPLRTGLFFGAEPAWGPRGLWRAQAGGRLEIRAGDDGKASTRRASLRLGLRARPGGTWAFDFAAELPVRGDGTPRWRMTATTGR